MATVAEAPLNYRIVYGPSEDSFYIIAQLTATLTLTIEDDFTSASAVISNMSHTITEGNIPGDGFINVFGIMWGTHSFYVSYPDNDLNDETFTRAWQQVYDNAPDLDNNLIWAIASNDQNYAYEIRNGSTSRTFELNGVEPETLQVVTGFSRWNSINANPGIAVVDSVAQYGVTYPTDFYAPYYPFARQDGSWLSCNRDGGSLMRYNGEWVDVMNSDESGYDNKAHYYDESWNKCLLVGDA